MNLNRRKFLAMAGGASALGFTAPLNSGIMAVPGASTKVGQVKITDIKTASVNIKYPAHLVKIETDSGLFGLGESVPRKDQRNGENRDMTGDIRNLKKYLVGKDPLQYAVLYEKMMREEIRLASYAGIVPGLISGVETALLDLAGKMLEVPVYTLLGGKFRDKILIYHDTGSPSTPDPKAWVDEARRSLDWGFKAMKFDLNPWRGDSWNRSLEAADIRDWMKILEAIKEELGPDIPFGVDFHWKFNPQDILKFLKEAEDLGLWFVEDPIPTHNADAMKKVTDSTTIPIVTGENLFTRHTFRPFIEKQAVDAIQIDTQKAGGLMETKWIADWANLYNIPMFVHNLCTPVGTMASGHACAAIQSCISLESDSVELPHWQNLVINDGSFYKEGYLEIPDKPGLGIELDEDVVREHLIEGSGYFE